MGRNSSVNLDKSKSGRLENIRSDHSAIRHSFRVTVDPEDGIFVILNAETYPVADICPGGINILCREKTAFTLSQVIENCELIIPGDSIKGLTARVVHRSCGSEGQWAIGIQWVGLMDTDLGKIVRQVSQIKNKLRRLDQDSAEP